MQHLQKSYIILHRIDLERAGWKVDEGESDGKKRKATLLFLKWPSFLPQFSLFSLFLCSLIFDEAFFFGFFVVPIVLPNMAYLLPIPLKRFNSVDWKPFEKGIAKLSVQNSEDIVKHLSAQREVLRSTTEASEAILNQYSQYEYDAPELLLSAYASFAATSTRRAAIHQERRVLRLCALLISISPSLTMSNFLLSPLYSFANEGTMHTWCQLIAESPSLTARYVLKFLIS